MSVRESEEAQADEKQNMEKEGEIVCPFLS
jgi:hypothetical protein